MRKISPKTSSYHSLTVHQSQFRLRQSIEKRRKWQAATILLLGMNVSDVLVMNAARKSREENENAKMLMKRSKRIRNMDYNLNGLSSHQQMKDFRFLLPEIRKISDLLQWSGVTKRSRYSCEPMVATSIFLYRMSTTTRWYEIEEKFGMLSSKLSEVFWEIAELFYKKFKKCIELRTEFLQDRCQLYANAIREAGSPLHSCVGFIDCTKIRMTRPGGSNAFQKSCYSGHKRFHCFSYQSLTTPDGLLFGLYGPVVGRRHDLTLLRLSNWDNKLQDCLNFNNRQFYIYGDGAYQLKPWIQKPFVGNLSEEEKNSMLK